MDLSAFASRLRDAIVASLRTFLHEHADESPYGFAIIQGQCGNYLLCAIATEEGLKSVVERYENLGYRYRASDWEEFDNREKLAVWLRWANPDDGWSFVEFPKEFQIQEHLSALVKSDAFGDDAENLEEFCTVALNALHSDPAWCVQTRDKPLIVGVTEGEDPRDFLRTATRCNPFWVVKLLWLQHWQADELSHRINRDERKPN